MVRPYDGDFMDDDRYPQTPRDHSPRNRYPHLYKLVKWIACLSDSETISLFWGHQQGIDATSESVLHYGGANKIFQMAWKIRHFVPLGTQMD